MKTASGAIGETYRFLLDEATFFEADFFAAYLFATFPAFLALVFFA
jgi:hypothetical protein